MIRPFKFNIKTLLPCFLLLCLSSFSQNSAELYYRLVNSAEHYYVSGQHGKADSCFQAAFRAEGIRGFQQDYLAAAANAYQLKDTGGIKHYLRGFSKRGGDYRQLRQRVESNVFLKTNAAMLFKFVLRKDNTNFRDSLDNNRQIYLKTLNAGLVKQVRKLCRADQRVRNGFNNLLPGKMQARRLTQTDQRNAQELLRLCREKGWPGFAAIGEFRPEGKYANEGIDLMIRHFSEEDLKQLEPFYLAAIQKVEAYPYAWASCMDYCAIKYPFYMDSLKVEFKQTYGTNSSNKVIIPFGTLSEVQKKRQELFLGDIGDYSLIRGWSLPTEEKVTVLRAHRIFR